MSWNVFISAPALANTNSPALEMLQRAGCKVIHNRAQHPLSQDTLREVLPKQQAILAGLDRFSATVLESPAAADLKIISRWGVGYDAVDVATATRLGIVVANTRGLLDEAVADYTFALLLSLARQIPAGVATVRAGEWKQAWGVDVHGQTLGLVGFGPIGQAVARRARGFNLRVLVCDPARSADPKWPDVEFVTCDHLLAESDFVSLHTALTPQTRGLIGEAQLRKMKPSALLINAARGALVDEMALTKALKEGWIAGAAMDVFQAEPLLSDHSFRKLPNVLLTPHQASFARQTAERVSLAAVQAIVDLMQGQRPKSVVNPEVFDSPALRASLRQ